MRHKKLSNDVSEGMLLIILKHTLFRVQANERSIQ